ncbi:alpha-hydroxy-acid oxidizing protein [Catenovulum sp. 2E275]|uniref:alpha-hydroxy acid oxidase n=1 Tax=Catenovulum sp. 2E275 TaxID=2980497 RepID=UPI0021D33D15|nr:alpha-hydroxy acid oxidase [Catenovulum sp. 2E275]MCU4677008.1 alpha-hydroxy-acid oxidizing protein [Catenovulum sp. 2E275]
MNTGFLNQIPREIAALDDYAAYAKNNLSAEAWAYIAGASADEYTLEYNAKAYSEIKLLNTVLTDVSHGHTQTQLLNETLAHPIITAPVAYQKLAHPDAEIATAMAAQAQDGLFVLSTLASTTIEDIVQKTQGPRWFQLYFQNTKQQTLELIQRAKAAGFSAIMVTVDSPINGLRNREQRSGFSLPAGVAAVNCQQVLTPNPIKQGESQVFQGFMSKAPSWQDIEWLMKNTDLPVLIKGIINPKDAQKAQQIGASGIVVSNHGGRTLDTLPSPIEVLPQIAAITDYKLPLIVDSGIRRGSDIFKAIALGASAVMIGRPIFYALATAGALGVAHAIRLLRDELELTMALCGCATLADISQDAIWQK